MNRISSHRVAGDQDAAVRAPVDSQKILIWSAWLWTLLLSKLPLVIARDILGADIPWITPAWLGIAALLIMVTSIWSGLRPLRSYLIVIGAIYLWTVFDPLIRGTAAWQNVIAGQPEIVVIFVDRVLLLLNTIFVFGTLLLMGAKRQDIFLKVGNLHAPVGGEAGPSGKRRLFWSVLGPGMAILLSVSFFAFLISQIPEGLSNLSAVIPWIPMILLSAGLNALGEEVTYRATTLGTLLPAVGPKHALWLTSLWFGLGHYYGGFPSGPAGLVQSGLLALLMGKAMLDTRG